MIASSSAVKPLQPATLNALLSSQAAAPSAGPALTPSQPPAREPSTKAPPPSQTTAQWVNARFATRPTVRSVVADVLIEAIKQLSPLLQPDLANISMLQPIADDPARRQPTSVLDFALQYLSARTKADFNETLFSPPLSDKDQQAIELAIRSFPTLLKPAFQHALIRYWGEAGAGPGEGDSRWLGLGNTLKDTLRTAALTQPGLTDAHRETLDQVVTWPDGTQRQDAKGSNAAKVFVLDTTLTHAGSTAEILSPDLLITRQIGAHTQLLHVTPAGIITPYESLDAFGKAWGERLQQTYAVDSLNWKRQEPQGNVFDTQAALLLNRQLENVASIAVPGEGTLNELQQLFTQASNPAPWFTETYTPPAGQLERMREKLPDWLRRATPQERFAYHAHTLELASSVQRNQGRTFLSDIPDVREFTRQQLQTRLQTLGLQADQLEVTFKVPVGTLGSGYIERVTMSLTDMALRNLAGLPKGEMEVHHNGQRLTDPALPQQLKDIITQVDIGQTYPDLLQRQLLDDTPATRERRALFAEQVPIQLAMHALELQLKGQAGISARGYQYLETVLTPGASEKNFEGEPIVVRPLAFLRKPGATPDVVANMFLIEPQASANGPHLLYRPMLAPPLQEFSTRQALLEAVQQPGPLQESVLAWLPDERTRAVYGNGGFKTPNIARYSAFNEFDAPETPAPTALAVGGYGAEKHLVQALREGQLMPHLFETNARSLVDLAQGQSVSDAQSRWASYKELGWLLFNTVLPVLKGPGAMAGWLLQLAGTEDDIKKLSNSNDEDPSAATVNLLVNVALLLAHASTPGAPEPTTSLEQFKEIAQSGGPVPHEPNGAPAQPSAISRQSPPEQVPGVIGNNNSALDFAFSSPQSWTTPRQRALIESFKDNAPQDPGSPIAEGPKKGLYLNAQNTLFAQIDNQWFRVAHDLDGIFIIDKDNKARTGPPLTRDAQGHWSIDTRPRLRAGGRRNESIADKVNENVQIEQQMQARHNQSIRDNAQKFAERDAMKPQVAAAITEYEGARKKLQTLWKLENQSDQQGRFTAHYETQLQTTRECREKLEQHLVKLEQLTQSSSALIQEQVETLNPRKLGGLDDTSEHKRLRSIDYGGMVNIHREIERARTLLVNGSNAFAVNGAPMQQLLQDASSGDSKAYREWQETSKSNFQDREKLRAAAEATQAVLEKWKNDSPFGKKNAEAYMKTQTMWPPAFTALKMKLGALTFLKELSLDRNTRTTDPGELYFLQRFKDNILAPISSSFVDQQQYSGYTLTERKAALETIIDKYEQSLNDCTSLNEANPAFFRGAYLPRFVERLGEVISDARSQLNEIIREEQSLAPAIPRQAEKNRPSRPTNGCSTLGTRKP